MSGDADRLRPRGSWPPVPEPAFAASGSPAQRRALLVSIAHPPSTEVGALRWEKIAQAASARGCTLDVLLVLPDLGAGRDDRRLDLLPAGSRIYDIPLRDAPLARLERSVRALLGQGASARGASAEAADGKRAGGVGRAARGGMLTAPIRAFRAWQHFARWDEWIERAVACGLALGHATSYAWIASSGPPHAAHEAARRISRGLARPLVVDFRDPCYVPAEAPPDMNGAFWRRRTAMLEARVVDAARLVVANTDSSHELLRARYPGAAARILTVMNGADGDGRLDPGDLGPRGPFLLAHTGSLYGGRDPIAFLRAVARVVSRHGLGPDQLRVHFMGDARYEGRAIADLAAGCGISDHVTCEGRRPREQALALMGSAAMLVVLPQLHVHAIPAKLFEYVQYPAWILVLCEAGVAIERLLRTTSADIVPPDDVEAIARVIEARLVAYRNAGRPQPLNADGRFDRVHQVARLLDALEGLA